MVSAESRVDDAGRKATGAALMASAWVIDLHARQGMELVYYDRVRSVVWAWCL